MNISLLIIGGAIGAVSRYLFGVLLMKRNKQPQFPVAMLVVNLLGSFGLGTFFSFYYGEYHSGDYSDPIYLGLVIGFFGAFTTFSTFSVESVQLFNDKKWKELIAYILISIMGAIFLFAFGFYIVNPGD
ncbi:fluoride efflux transporter CrcB [Gracilibacillus kekensis]|uniref:Fluoride-specific ion channel FluC n=1 Tax=Gracilibacillus kekensis TaxID=1027249 RepID=A0A1M7MTH8_9BACI|nr:fluoride efflux transporter CrcB [Gracilibacillus kekensis]SHM94286.1 CrcB protein [Gracilibacillus kekensis]